MGLLVASAARTASGNAGPFAPAEAGQNLAVVVDTTAVSGTSPSMTPSVEWSQDGGATWAQADVADAFNAITAVGTKARVFAVKGQNFRIVWVITGTTPSFTFSVRGYVTGA